jgi:hypothetical protein
VEDLKAAGNLDVGTSKAISVHSIVAKPSWEGTRNACFGALDHRVDLAMRGAGHTDPAGGSFASE